MILPLLILSAILNSVPGQQSPNAPGNPAAALAVAPTAPQASPVVFSPGSGSYTSGTTINLSTTPSVCDPYIFWSSTNNPPTTGDNNSTSFQVLGTATIYAKVINCPGFTNSIVTNQSYSVGTSTNIFNCSSGFSTSGACSVSQHAGAANFWNPYANGSSNINVLLQAGDVHAGRGFIYQSPVNIQAFTASYTFIPSGNNIAFVLQNNTNSGAVTGLCSGTTCAFSSGAGCEAGFFQAAGTYPPWPNNIIALDISSEAYLNPTDTTNTYSNTQIFTEGQDPCQPNDADPYWVGIPRISTSPVPLTSPANNPNSSGYQNNTTGHTYSATVGYDGSNLSLCLYDVTLANGSCSSSTSGTGTFFQHTWTGISIPSIVGGNTAYIGFTASSGNPATSEYINGFSYTTSPPPTVSTPTFSPAAGTYTSAQTVSILDATSGATIYYTTDGTTPTTSSTVYSGPITVSSSETLKAIAVKNGYANSMVGIASYVIGSSGSVNILAATRSTNWQGVGMSGGIPAWPACSGGTIAAYGSSGSPGSPSTINSALSANSGNKCYVMLGSGDFYLTSGINMIGLQNVALQGAGPQSTRIHIPDGGVGGCAGGFGSCVLGFQSSDGTSASNPPFVNWTAGFSQGTNQITVSNSTGVVAGQTMAVLDQCDDGMTGSTGAGNCTGTSTDNTNYFNCSSAYNGGASGGGSSWVGIGCDENGPNNTSRGASGTNFLRNQQEQVLITACSPSCNNSGTTVLTISPAIEHPNWRSGQFPQAWYIQAAQNVGVRDIAIDGTGFSQSGLNFGIGISNMANFFIYHMAITNFANTGIFVAQSTNGTILSNYTYAIGALNNSNDSWGIQHGMFNSLIANNIWTAGKIEYACFAPCSGNAIVANYSVNSYTGEDTAYSNFLVGHNGGADFNLFEENVTPMILFDQTHGVQKNNTLYRNFVTGFESCGSGQCGSFTVKDSDVQAIAPLAGNRYNNFVGNVIGTPGVNTLGYQYINNSGGFFNGSGNGYPYNYCSGNQAVTNAFPIDPYCAATQLLWGNWDSFHAATQWNTSEVPSGISVYPNPVPTACVSGGTCPASFVFTSRPNWWSSSITYPAIGPDVTGGNVGQCSGTIGTSGEMAGTAALSSGQCPGTSLTTGAWGGHINAIPAMVCYLNVLGGKPDGSTQVTFNPSACGY